MKTRQQAICAGVLLACAGAPHAATFEINGVQGSFDSTVSAGVGVRAQDRACSHVIGSAGGASTPPGGSSAGAGCADSFSGYNDQGNLNYDKHDRFTTYLKGTHELLLTFPDDVKFLARMSWLRDFAATHASGNLSALGSAASFPDDSSRALRHKERLLDLWVSKAFQLGEERGRVRVGNQVLNWGESLFLPGGLNQTNSLDLLRLSQPVSYTHLTLPTICSV